MAMESDNGPIIVVTTYNLLATAFLATTAKVVTKWSVIRHFQMDDLYIIMSLLCAAGYAVALQFQMQAGLGRSIATMNSDDFEKFGKAEYSQEILYVSSLGFAKWTVLEYMLTLAIHKSHKIVSRIALWTNILKTVAAIIALAFQCGLPKPWDILQGRCFHRIAFWNAFGCLDIAVDLATIALPIFLINQLQMQQKYRWKAIAAFSLRIFVIPIIIVRLIFLNQYHDSNDRPRTDYSINVTTSVHITVSIIASCMPFLKKIFQNISLGMYGAEMPASKYTDSQQRAASKDQGRPYQMRSGIGTSSAATSRKDSEAASAQGSRGESGLKTSSPTGIRDNSIEHLLQKEMVEAGHDSETRRDTDAPDVHR